MPTYPSAQPYGALSQITTKLRSSFPEIVDASVLKKLEIAPNNESYIINALRFLDVIDSEGRRQETAHDLFVKSDDDFGAGFAELVNSAYKGLFDLHGNEAWSLAKSKLIAFFRTEDKSTELVGGRQAETFIRFSEIAGKREAAKQVPRPKNEGTVRSVSSSSKRRKKVTTDRREKVGAGADGGHNPGKVVTLAVRVEVNLPATPDQEVYDAIFKSIRSNLIDGE